MRTVLFLLSLVIGLGMAAQNRCLPTGYFKLDGLAEANALLKSSASQKSVPETTVIRIPVAVHLLYNNASQNISDEQIQSGIEALNRDFRRRAADTVITPQRFKNKAADAQIEFYLATADPFGRKTTAILRKQTSRNGWAADDKMKKSTEGGDDAWDSKAYFNIWIVNLIGVSGYASLPGSAEASDGVVIHYNAFGTINAPAPFNRGRTAVHETGHWLGLKHIWGDIPCGDDGIDDTPTQSFFTKGCPSDFRSSCNNDETGDMYMNFMDYTDDACMNLFTKGQRDEMRGLFAEGGLRASLLQSKGLLEPWVEETPLPLTTIAVYPNPANEKIVLPGSDELIGKKLSLINGQGQVLKTFVITSLQQSFSVAEIKPGVYFLRGEKFFQKFIKL